MYGFISRRQTTVDDVTLCFSMLRKYVEAIYDGKDNVDGVPLSKYPDLVEEKTGIRFVKITNKEGRDLNEKREERKKSEGSNENFNS